MTGFNPAILETAVSQAQFRLEAYLQNNLTSPAVSDVIGGRKTIIQDNPVLPSSLPNKIKVLGVRYDQLPDRLKYHVSLELFNTSFDQQLGSPSLTYTLPLSRIGLKRLGITYQPSSPVDEETLQNQINTGTGVLSTYLISVKPVLKLDEIVLKSGTGVTMGSDQLIDVIIHSPTTNHRMSYRSQVAGDEMIVSINGGGIDIKQVSERAQAVANNTAAENLHMTGLSYWAEADFMTQAIASALKVNALRLPSVGLFSSPLSVVYSFGIPRTGYYIQRTVDIKRNIHAIGAVDTTVRRAFLRQTGMLHSYLESSILEQVFHYWHGTGVSTAQVFIDANKQGIPIYQINNTNAASILPRLTMSDSTVLADVNNALNAGLEVMIPERQPDKFVGAAAMGYLLYDPVTGAGSYRISGGLEGGAGEGPCAEPEPQPLVEAFKAIVLTSIFLAMLTVITAGSVGAAAPATVPAGNAAIARLMTTLGLSVLTFPATAGNAFCNPSPERRNKKDSKNAVHNICANTRSGNIYKNLDVCVAAPNIKPKRFDAYNGSILWEVKTYNGNNGNLSFLVGLDKDDWLRESAIAKACGFSYWYTVGDFGHPPEIEKLSPNFVPNIADNLEVDPVNCLQPDKKP